MWIISLFLALILVAILQMWFFSRQSLKSLSYKRWFTPTVVNEGDSVTLYETIRNEKLLPIPWVRIEAGISPNLVFGSGKKSPEGGRHFHRSIFSLAPYSTVTRRHQVLCARRGYYQIPTVAVTAGELLGIGKPKSQEFSTDTLVIVYPTLIPIQDIFQEKNSFTGDVVVRRWIVDDPFMPKGVRAYTGFEPYNRINWKATARTGEIQVNDFDFTADIRLMILVNIDMDPTQWTVAINEDQAEYALAIAASVAQYALDNGIETGFSTNARELGDMQTVVHIAPQTGNSQIKAIFDTIAKLSLNRTVTFSTLLQQVQRSGLSGYDILVISTYTDSGIDEQISALRRSGNYVEVLRPEPQVRTKEVPL